MHCIGFIGTDDICWPAEKQSQGKSPSWWIYLGLTTCKYRKLIPLSFPSQLEMKADNHLNLNKDRELQSDMWLRSLFPQIISPAHIIEELLWLKSVWKVNSLKHYSGCKMVNKQQTGNAFNSLAQKRFSFVNGKLMKELPLVIC